MAAAVLMPKLGNTVESCLIVEWRKSIGDQVTQGEVLCEVETDKATLEVASTASGTVLALYFKAGEDVPVLSPIAAIGAPGEEAAGPRPDHAGLERAQELSPDASEGMEVVAPGTAVTTAGAPLSAPAPIEQGMSPRARKLADQKGLSLAGVEGSGPGGRIIERDVLGALAAKPALTPVAKKMVGRGDFTAPTRGTGIGGRITKKDLIPAGAHAPASAVSGIIPEDVETVPVKGVRKLIAERMLNSLQTTAQLTLNASADARALLAYRQRLKDSPETLGLQPVTVNDLILFVVSRTLPEYPDLNALFTGDTISRHQHVHLGLAVDTPRGLMAPVIRNAQQLSLKQISDEARRLAADCLDGRIQPDDLSGGTFTVSNLGALGIESFTPILNPPQVAILGVGNVNLKPVEVEGEVKFIPHLGLSLTINHQVVDGAPGARFLQALARGLADLELLLAL